MHFIIIGRDGTDTEALKRRLAVREAHSARIREGIAQSEQIMAAAMLNENEDMCGSVMIVDFESRDALDAWLKDEPYITGNVWEKIEIIPCKIPPVFLDK